MVATNRDSGRNVCFIVGSPRSGTTVLGEIIGRHPEVAQLYEPYFLWEWCTGPGEDDQRTIEQATPEVRRFVRREFGRYLEKSGRRVLLEKTPVNSFRIPFIDTIFPDAHWIHLLRDGRDATVSIHREWERRRKVVQSHNMARLLKLVRSMVGRQPYWRNRIQAICYEVRQQRPLNAVGLMNKAKWRGTVGWGPRFPGWYEALQNVEEVIEFNALQWRRCVEAVETDLKTIPNERRIEIRYEDLVTRPDEVLEDVQRFMGVDVVSGLGLELGAHSVGQWRTDLSAEHQRRVNDLLYDKLVALGYEIEMTNGSGRA